MWQEQQINVALEHKTLSALAQELCVMVLNHLNRAFSGAIPFCVSDLASWGLVCRGFERWPLTEMGAGCAPGVRNRGTVWLGRDL